MKIILRHIPRYIYTRTDDDTWQCINIIVTYRSLPSYILYFTAMFNRLFLI